jgi:hypothetical protein
MNKPLSAGDVCKVVGGLGRHKSPNLGISVVIVARVFGEHGGDHSQYGPMYQCAGAEIKQLTDSGAYVTTGRADFAGIWLERIEPLPDQLKSKLAEKPLQEA